MATEENVDNFAAAFDQLAALGDKQVPVDFSVQPPDAAAAAAEAAATKAEADKAVETAVEEVVAPVEGEIEELTEEEKAAAAAEEKPAPKTEEQITDREADLIAKFAKAVKGEEPPKVETRVESTPQAQPLFSPQEAEFLQQFSTDWPDVAKANNVLLRAMGQQITTHIFTEIAKTLQPRLALLEQLADRTHDVDLHSAVEDYDDVRDKVIDWAAKQPAYLRQAYDRVISEGTVDEVKDLIDRYRKDTGAVLTKPTAPVAPAKTVTELSTTAKKAAAALAPVGSKRSAVVRQTSPDDFEGAFAEFAKLET